MPKKKIAVAMSEMVLEKLDAAAGQAGVSRSLMVEEAVAQYVAQHRKDMARADYREAALAALEDAKAIAREYHADPANANAPSSLQVLRAIRSGEADEW